MYIPMLVVMTMALLIGYSECKRNLKQIPTPWENEHLHNQTLMICEGPHYGIGKIEPVPSHFTTHEPVYFKLEAIPKTDIFLLRCKLIVKWNGIPIFSEDVPDVCSDPHIPVQCPFFKGEIYHFKSKTFSNWEFLMKGHYHAEGSCRDQNKEEIVCAIYDFSWH